MADILTYDGQEFKAMIYTVSGPNGSANGSTTAVGRVVVEAMIALRHQFTLEIGPDFDHIQVFKEAGSRNYMAGAYIEVTGKNQEARSKAVREGLENYLGKWIKLVNNTQKSSAFYLSGMIGKES